MKGPIGLVRSLNIAEYKNVGPVFEWQEGDAYLIIDEVLYKGKTGVILCYQNPPVHQVSTIGLYAYHDGLNRVLEKLEHLDFLILYGANDPVHSGGISRKAGRIFCGRSKKNRKWSLLEQRLKRLMRYSAGEKKGCEKELFFTIKSEAPRNGYGL